MFTEVDNLAFARALVLRARQMAADEPFSVRYELGLSDWQVTIGDVWLEARAPRLNARVRRTAITGFGLAQESQLRAAYLQVAADYRSDHEMLKISLPNDAVGDELIDRLSALVPEESRLPLATTREIIAQFARPRSEPPSVESLETLLPELTPEAFRSAGVRKVPRLLSRLVRSLAGARDAARLNVDPASVERSLDERLRSGIEQAGHADLMGEERSGLCSIEGRLLWVIRPDDEAAHAEQRRAVSLEPVTTPPGVRELPPLPESLSYLAFEGATFDEFTAKLAELRDLIETRIDAATHSLANQQTAVFHQVVELTVEELRLLGHRLWSMDYGGDIDYEKTYDRWGCEWKAGANGLDIRFSPRGATLCWVIGPEQFG